MNKLLSFTFIFIIMISSLACQRNKQAQGEGYWSVQAKELKSFTGSYLGNNSAMRNIVSCLPGGSAVDGIGINPANLELTIYYQTANGNDVEQENVFSTGELTKVMLLNNALCYFMLVPNIETLVQVVYSGDEMLVDTTLSKKELGEKLEIDFTDYSQNGKDWDYTDIEKLAFNEVEEVVE